MSPNHPWITQVDHVGIHVRDPERLYRFFTEDLSLPVAFPFKEYPNYTTGSVVLGNAFLEIMRFGEADWSEAGPASYKILGFMFREGATPGALADLEARGVPHSGLIPFFAPQASDENPIKLWANVYLGGLAPGSFWTGLFFRLTKGIDPEPSDYRSPAVRRLSLELMRRAFRGGMVVLTEYLRGYDAEIQQEHRRALAEAGGGILGLANLARVTVGAAAQDGTWQRLLAEGERREDRYQLGAGPELVVDTGRAAGLLGVTLAVESIAAAIHALDETGAAVQQTTRGVRFQPPGLSNLWIDLIDS